MVSFICDACGNTVKKTQVEKHYTTVCRNCSVLSCLDCGVDFPGDAYISHTSCVTEAEKYQGHLYQAKDKENKGETKQKEWLRSVQGTSSQTADPKLRNLRRNSLRTQIFHVKRRSSTTFVRTVLMYTTPKHWINFGISLQGVMMQGNRQVRVKTVPSLHRMVNRK